MNETDNKIVTQTLAKLYEQQGNYKKALEIYKKIAEKQDDEFIKKKIKYLQELISSNKTKSHDEIASLSLSDSDKSVFNIFDSKNDQKNDKYSEELRKIIKSQGYISNIISNRFSDITLDQLFSLISRSLDGKRKLKDIKLSEILQVLDKI